MERLVQRPCGGRGLESVRVSTRREKGAGREEEPGPAVPQGGLPMYGETEVIEVRQPALVSWKLDLVWI